MKPKAGASSTALLVGALLIVAVIAIASTMYFYNQYQGAQQLLKDPTAIGKKEINELTAKVSKLIVLPKDESPTIATVTDAKQLSKEPFFRNAKNGDKVLIYPKARKAILYRPSENLIIETAPVNIGPPTSQTTPAVSPIPVKTVAPTIKK